MCLPARNERTFYPINHHTDSLMLLPRPRLNTITNYDALEEGLFCQSLLIRIITSGVATLSPSLH
jgi:hypothetical protein